MPFAMPLFKRKAIGVEISPQGVFCALMSGDQKAPCLERVASRSFEGAVIKPSLRELNVLDPEVFRERLKEAHGLLLHKGSRLSVTLPDSVGRVILMDVDGRFKNRSEALDVIRWKLKKSLPFEPSETHLDYQQLTIRENNELSLLVTLVSRPVISQYEELMISAGFTPARIDLNIFNLCRVFEKRLAHLEQYTLVSYYGSSLAVMGVVTVSPVFSGSRNCRAHMELITGCSGKSAIRYWRTVSAVPRLSPTQWPAYRLPEWPGNCGVW